MIINKKNKKRKKKFLRLHWLRRNEAKRLGIFFSICLSSVLDKTHLKIFSSILKFWKHNVNLPISYPNILINILPKITKWPISTAGLDMFDSKSKSVGHLRFHYSRCYSNQFILNSKHVMYTFWYRTLKTKVKTKMA